MLSWSLVGSPGDKIYYSESAKTVVDCGEMGLDLKIERNIELILERKKQCSIGGKQEKKDI